jgi:hypothetical protein
MFLAKYKLKSCKYYYYINPIGKFSKILIFLNKNSNKLLKMAKITIIWAENKLISFIKYYFVVLITLASAGAGAGSYSRDSRVLLALP